MRAVSLAVAEDDAKRALATLVETCAGLRSGAIVAAGGELLAESAEGDWSAQVRRLWSALDGERKPPATQVHVATEAGELFAVRSGAITVVALTDRFALASLMFCDLRSVLRDLPAVADLADGEAALDAERKAA